MWFDVVFTVVCYLLGAIPFMVLLARAKGITIMEGEDLHAVIWNRLGGKWGLLGASFDIIVKGVVPPIAGYYLGFPLATVMSGSLASVAGQMWPVFRRFDGEKGNTVSLGLFLAVTILYQYYIMWLIFIPAIIGASVKLLPKWFARGKSLGERVRIGGQPQSKSLPVGILFGFMLMPIVSALSGRPLEFTVALAVLFFIIVLRRLTADGLMDDLKTGGRLGSVLWNRFLYDRSFV
jgi:glycerol-3-phosphate acyltransferase PlsY